MGGLNKQGEEKNRVPDTAHDCPILRIGVMQEQPVSERKNLSKEAVKNLVSLESESF